VKALSSQSQLKEMKQRINDEVAITMQMVIDEIEDTYVRLSLTETNDASEKTEAIKRVHCS